MRHILWLLGRHALTVCSYAALLVLELGILTIGAALVAECVIMAHVLLAPRGAGFAASSLVVTIIVGTLAVATAILAVVVPTLGIKALRAHTRKPREPHM